jgi:hypothetical protein
MSLWRFTFHESLVLDSDGALHRPYCKRMNLDRDPDGFPIQFIEAGTDELTDDPYVGLSDCPDCLPETQEQVVDVEFVSRFGALPFS